MGNFKIMDGAMGSELIRRGLSLPEHTWSADANINNPEMVQKIHMEYVDAGADYITANTFRTTPRAYKKSEISDESEEAVETARVSLYKGVELAKDAARNSVKVIGSIAPLEDCYSPDLFPGRDNAHGEFSQLGEWLTSAGVDILLLETMNNVAETEAALISIENFGLPIWVSFVLKDHNYLLSGEKISKAIERMNNYIVDCMLLNCNTLERTLMAVENLVSNWPHRWGVYPNLGIGEPSSDGHILHYEKMDYFLSTMDKIVGMGPFIIGACCGSSPEHIQGLNNLKYVSPS